ncbi:hypothetical protein N9V25_03350 [Flavobacteriaceae bacterium]|nr:hypothetical protein [Flavobacteriaceae bacterium]
MNFSTAQEEFWFGEFGNEYISRANTKQYLASNLNFFSRAFNKIQKPNSLIEFGANVGFNLKAIKQLFPNIELTAVEINKSASVTLSDFLGKENVFNISILDYNTPKKFDIALIKLVLIHINPEMLPTVYEKLYQSSNKYILIAEYYNPYPVTVNYRGHNDRLFKRDFSGELLEMYDDLELIDYGFVYKRDNVFPLDDVTWFLLEKK